MLITHLAKVLFATVTLYLSTRDFEYSESLVSRRDFEDSDGYKDSLVSNGSDLLLQRDCEVLRVNRSSVLQSARVLEDGTFERSGSGGKGNALKEIDDKESGDRGSGAKGTGDKKRGDRESDERKSDDKESSGRGSDDETGGDKGRRETESGGKERHSRGTGETETDGRGSNDKRSGEKRNRDKGNGEDGSDEQVSSKDDKQYDLKGDGKGTDRLGDTKAEESGKKQNGKEIGGIDKHTKKDKTVAKGSSKNEKVNEGLLEREGKNEKHNETLSEKDIASKKQDGTSSENLKKQDKKNETATEGGEKNGGRKHDERNKTVTEGVDKDETRKHDKKNKTVIESGKNEKQLEIPSQEQNATTRIRFCGVIDENEDETIGNATGFRFKRYIRQGKIWKKTQLTWTLRTPSARSRELPEGAIRREMIAAMRLWEQETTLRFQEVHKDSRDIDIYIDFRLGDHGDGNKFDGKGGTLAHAYYPGEGIGGDMHFDDAENFTPHEDTVQYKSNSLLVTAAHELGHALGLSHSDVGEALMAPWYQTFPKDFNKLPLDDRRGIQALYGRPEEHEPTEIQTLPPRPTRPPPRPTTTTTRRPRPTPKPTRPPRPTIRPPPPTERPPPPTERPPPPTERTPPPTERTPPPTEKPPPPPTDRPLFPTGIPPKPTLGPPRTTPRPTRPTEPTDPQTTPDTPIPPCPVHPKPTDVPDTCDTDFDAVTVYRREIYFFKGRFYWRISRMGRLYENESPHYIHALFRGLPQEVDHIEAAYENKDDNIVFISNGKYYELNNRLQLFETGTLLSRGVNASRINGGMIWSYNGRVYLFSKTQYWRLDYDDQAEIDYPRGIEVWQGLPPNFSGALSYRAKTYFFAGRVFWVFNPMEMRLADPPMVTATYWLSCPNRNQKYLVRCAIVSGQSSTFFSDTFWLYFVIYVIVTL